MGRVDDVEAVGQEAAQAVQPADDRLRGHVHVRPLPRPLGLDTGHMVEPRTFLNRIPRITFHGRHNSFHGR